MALHLSGSLTFRPNSSSDYRHSSPLFILPKTSFATTSFTKRHSWLTLKGLKPTHNSPRVIPVLAIGRGNFPPPSPGGSGSMGDWRKDSFLESSYQCPVPREQQPVFEYESLVKMSLFSWVTMGPVNYALRLVAVGFLFSVFIGWPVASITFNPRDQALQCVLGTLAGGQLAATLTVLRLYLGYAYVGNRLFSATVEYEETGWYDGEIWVKTPELLARDRLLASYKVKPALNRLKLTLIGLGLSLGVSSLLLFFLPSILPSPERAPLLTPEDALRSVPRGGYNSRAAQRYEPEAFQDEDFEGGEEMAFPEELGSVVMIPGCGPVEGTAMGE